jgi:hypothetical protein
VLRSEANSARNEVDRMENTYFNYFTQIEEHFQKRRGGGVTLLSTLEWAQIESWKNAAVPLEAVLRGIDDAFETAAGKKINSIAYCSQAVAAAAENSARNRAAK